MSGEVRVLVYHAATDHESVRLAYQRVSQRMRDVPGLLGNDLLGAVRDSRGFLVMSRWADLNAFLTWEAGPDHRDTTAPLRPFRDERFDPPFGVYQVVDSF
ncbi:antibiotic biosynthesis monooxygenase family protein [Micromonospora sp. LOL_021]|uniref:antibiotic biosynthesis monooxygenase family protein n=1 Tax=Micromonospora sp. LOL_021 TaxID=3345417 RepID=UPI003A88C1DB